MTRKIVVTALVAVFCLVPLAQAASLETKVAYRYHAVVKKFSHKAAGRNILDQGIRFKWVSKDGARKHWAVRRATDHELAVHARQLRKLLVPRVTPVPPSRPPAGTQTARPGANIGALPACADESAGNYSTGPGNTNPSGATGRWQEMPLHRARGGLCYGLGMDPAGQDECAVRIFKAQGSGAWTACG